ncbi:hypothetical protein LVJ94_34695 [Pendulispora rubella]|uniref:Uncharacterized protein n=1 Tax=Pendulispora rubella TaxID=2741070 RepID=A0ABZ2KTQ8_9BACT
MTEELMNTHVQNAQSISKSEEPDPMEPTLFCSDFGTAEPGIRVEFTARTVDGNVTLRNVRWDTIASETGIPRADVCRLLPKLSGEAFDGKRWTIVEQDESGCLMVCHRVDAKVCTEVALQFAAMVTAAAQKKEPPNEPPSKSLTLDTPEYVMAVINF